MKENQTAFTTTEKKKPNLELKYVSVKPLNAVKKMNLEESYDKALEAALNFFDNYDQIENFKINVKANPALREAIEFIYGDLFDVATFGFEDAMSIKNFGDPKTKDTLSYRELKLIQRTVQHVKFTGKEIAIKLATAMEAIAPFIELAYHLEQKNEEASKEFHTAIGNYSKFCRNYNVEGVNIEAHAEYIFEQRKAKEQKETSATESPTEEKPAKKSRAKKE